MMAQFLKTVNKRYIPTNEHGGLVIGYQSLAEYHKDIDTVVIQFINTTDFNGFEWNLSEIVINVSLNH